MLTNISTSVFLYKCVFINPSHSKQSMEFRGFFCPNVFIFDVIYRSWSRTSDTTILSIDLNVWGTRRHFVQLRNERRVKKQPIYVLLMNLLHFFPKSKLWVPTIRAGSNFFFFRCPIMVRPF